MEHEQYLKEMGFSENKIKRAIKEKGKLGLQACMEWILEHGDDPEVEDNQVPSASAGDGQTDSAAPDPATKSEESSLTKEEKAQMLQDKINERRREKEELEKQNRIEQEKRRRREGKDLTKLKSDLEYRETQKLVEERKRDKIEDNLARERVRKQIEQDREERRREREERMNKSSGAGVSSKPSTTSTTSSSTKSDRPAPTDARLQIVCPDGSKLVQTFKAQEQLSAVRLYVQMNRKDPIADPNAAFGLMSAFPKKIFTGDDYDSPLSALGLAPSAVLHVTKVL